MDEVVVVFRGTYASDGLSRVAKVDILLGATMFEVE